MLCYSNGTDKNIYTELQKRKVAVWLSW